MTPAITTILTSHRKPTLPDAIESLLAQTRQDFRIVVMDSGQWGDDEAAMRAAFKRYANHTKIEWHFTGEPPDFNRQACAFAVATNTAIRSFVTGSYVNFAYDDDIYYPRYYEVAAGFLDQHPEALAVWYSADRLSMSPNGAITQVGRIEANEPKTGGWDCHVDGAQVMVRSEVFDLIPDPWWPEDAALSSCGHADGIFLEKLGVVAGPVPNIPEVLTAHRSTPWSAYSPSK